MAAEDYVSDREQEEALLQWWKENWVWVIAGIGLGLAGVLGWQFFKRYETTQAEAAAQIYTDLSTALTALPSDGAKADSLVKQLDSEYGSTPYALQAHLLMAQNKATAGQFDQAGNELKVVIDRADDPELVQIAKLRLARVQLQLGRPDDALGLLDIAKAGAFAGQINDIRGDALLAKGDRSGAKAAYEAAMTEFAGEDPQIAEFTRLKLLDLADVASPAVAISGEAVAPNEAGPKAEVTPEAGK